MSKTARNTWSAPQSGFCLKNVLYNNVLNVCTLTKHALNVVWSGASSGPAQYQCNKWSRKRLSWFPLTFTAKLQRSLALMGSNSPARRILSSPKHTMHPPSWDVMGYWCTAEGFFRRAGQLWQSRSWPAKPEEKGRNVDVLVVHTLLECTCGT